LIFKQTANKWKYISESAIDTGVAASIVRALSFGFPDVSVSYYDHTRWYSSRIDNEIEYEQKMTGQKAVIISQSEAFKQNDFKIFKIMIITFDQKRMMAVRAMLDRLQIPGISIQQSGTAYLEITSIDAKKSRGIDYIMCKEALHTDETAGFGDGHNDLPMLNMVGLPIVMANALDEIKRVAKFVTKSNEENGVAFALKTVPDFK
jgi:Cof subfamily protein (haloacid dehalogenase superfamily)